MSVFLPQFDTLNDDMITLRLTGTYDEDGVQLPFYYYDIYLGECVVGKISIRIGHNYHSYYNGNIGYEVFEEFRGRGIATRACRLVIEVARAHGMTQLALTCRADNHASLAVIRRLGATFLETAPVPTDCFFWFEGIGTFCIFRLDIAPNQK